MVTELKTSFCLQQWQDEKLIAITDLSSKQIQMICEAVQALSEYDDLIKSGFCASEDEFKTLAEELTDFAKR